MLEIAQSQQFFASNWHLLCCRSTVQQAGPSTLRSRSKSLSEMAKISMTLVVNIAHLLLDISISGTGRSKARCVTQLHAFSGLYHRIALLETGTNSARWQ